MKLKHLICIVVLMALIGTVSATTTFYLNSGNSDLTGGADFSNNLTTSTSTPSTLQMSIVKAATETQYAWTQAGIPNNADWETNGFTIRLNVTAVLTSTDIHINVQVDRVFANGTVRESSATSTEQDITAAGLYTYSIASKDWSAGTATDRMRVQYLIRNSKTSAARTVDFSFNDINSYVITTVTIVPPPDTTPPASITGLTNSTTCNSINWTFTKPADADFNHTYTLKDNVFSANLSNTTQYSLWSGLAALTSYTLSSKTVDITGNMNATWVNQTATTLACVPVSAFAANVTTGTTPLSVGFTDASTNTPTNWDWYMWANETKTSDDQNPVITFTEVGTYNIRLYASNAGGGDWENKTGYITANAAPAGQEYGNWTDFYVNSTSALTDYQVSIILDNRTGTSSTTLFYTNGTTRSDWMDIKWTDTSNATLGFWKENNTDTSTNSTWWIKVPTVASDNTTKIRIFYGNASQTTSSMNGYTTFRLFDDFSVATVNSTTWSTATGSISITEGVVELKNTATSSIQGLRSRSEYPTGTAVRSYTRNSINSSSGGLNTIFAETGYDNWGVKGITITKNVQNYTDIDATAYNGTQTVLSIGNDGTIWKVYDIIRVSDSSAKYRVSPLTTYSEITTNIPTGGINVTLRPYETGTPYISFYTDWIFVRNYTTLTGTTTEPFLTYTTDTGSEVTAPVASFTLNKNYIRIPNSVTATDTSTNTPTSWQWSWGDGTANSTTQNPSHQYLKRGKWDIVLTATNAGGSGTTGATSVKVVGYENYY